MYSLVTVLLLAATLAMGGCPSQPPKPSSTAPTETNAGASSEGANAATAAGRELGSQEEIGGPQAGTLATRIVYFDFDSAVIKGQGVDVVAAHAKYLAANSQARVRLEGNTDERGSREYNIGLGDRRAQSVRRALLLQGVAEGQITTVSYGEERPADPGHDEAAWAKNRRVEIVYLTPADQPVTPPKP
ncbi:MAG TPA: peptidoglycan-associated lipoprotein Pal [Steroidobacteraceae bacterium]|nr:peptidoglycan-associated lipoprotein Pal [Steroidobacteraceae bacterium]